MRTFWRISNFSDLSGEGGRIASGRWHTEGSPIVYLTESPASAMLERLVHFVDGNGRMPRTYTLLEIEAPGEIAIESLFTSIEVDWKNRMEITRAVGDLWLQSTVSLLARVPSAIVPRTWNYLLNPLHADAPQIRIVSEIRERFDTRLFHSGPR